MSRDAFIHQLGNLATIRHMWRFEALRRVPLFAKLSDAQRDGLAAALEQVTFPKGTAVVTQVGAGVAKGACMTRNSHAQDHELCALRAN